MRDKKVLFITQAAAIAAIYVVLTLVFAPISFGQVQVRISEILTILPFLLRQPFRAFYRCMIANVFGGAIVVDIIFGSIATLFGSGRKLPSGRTNGLFRFRRLLQTH